MEVLKIVSEIIINYGIGHGFLFLFLLRRQKSGVVHWSFVLLLISLSLVILRIHYLYFYFWHTIGSTFFGSGPFLFLLAPALYLYLRSVVQPESGFKNADLGHFVLFSVVGVFTLVLVNSEGDQYLIMKQVIGTPWLFMVIQFGYYLYRSRKLVRFHQDRVTQGYSNLEGLDVSWIKYILWLFGLLLFFFIVITPLIIHGVNLTTYKIFASLFFTLIMLFITYKGVRQRVTTEITNGNDSNTETIDTKIEGELKTKLINYMESQKPYLDPELTLVDLAKQLSISRNQLSAIINSGIGDNFYSFVNQYRVEEVKKLIQEDSKKQYTIMALASDAGFNSKSSFNNIFKKVTGLTPSEYRDGLK